MDRYNYPAKMAGDIRAWLLEHPDTAKTAGKMKTREERNLYLQTILQEENEVTGGEGSIYNDPFLLEELLCHFLCKALQRKWHRHDRACAERRSILRYVHENASSCRSRFPFSR